MTSQAFYPYSFPQPNMLVQEGSIAIIDGLVSEAGQRLNGKKAKAIKFFPTTCCWSVQLVEPNDNNGGDDDYGTIEAKKQLKIHIKNMELYLPDGSGIYFTHIPNPDPYQMLSVGGGLLSVRAGTVGDDPSKPAICILGDVLSTDFDKQAAIETGSMMGITKGFSIKKYIEAIEDMHAKGEF